MEYEFNPQKFNIFVSNWQKSQYAFIVFICILFFLMTAEFIVKKDVGGIIFMLVGWLYLFWWFEIRSIRFQSRSINRAISYIKWTDDLIKIQTVDFAAFWGLVRKSTIDAEYEARSVTLSIAKPDNPIKAKNLGAVYLLKHQNEEYFLIEGFFDDFEDVLAELKNHVALK
ncbi:MAG: hypothetical protein Q8927_10865 [Bacteroidota bacterium]|nr:hypothetical protein [Bacteroidota bacterium]MDP4216691.1 hypothetical protein [Bacteroidota bacterium]MDP4244205.1 hypothetical protein [Bacteroidota bacterium]MDP4258864.1 hypothetical protein [Bacteroidota bacterium]